MSMSTETDINTALTHGRRITLRLAFCGLVLASGAMLARLQAAEESKDIKQTVVVGLTQWNNDISTLRTTLSGTIGALEEVKATAAKSGALAKPYATFSDAMAGLEAQVAKLRERGTATKARAKEHWAAWQTELTTMQNVKLREKAQSRYSATQKEFQKIQERVDAAKEVFAPLMADLKDVDTYLKADLSKEAVDSLSGTIWNMGRAAQKVDARLLDLNEQINRVVKKMPQ